MRDAAHQGGGVSDYGTNLLTAEHAEGAERKAGLVRRTCPLGSKCSFVQNLKHAPQNVIRIA
jgi:hypothetical protein